MAAGVEVYVLGCEVTPEGVGTTGLLPASLDLGGDGAVADHDPFEVADVFEVPLRFVLDPANHRRQSYRRGALTRGYYVLPYRGRFIWGATAGMLVNLAEVLD